MKKKKLLLKIIIIIPLFFIVFITSLYLYAKTRPKLPIKAANQYYIYDKDGTILETSTDSWTTLDDISPYLIKATLSIEDKNFYKHHGFDLLRIIKSLYINAKNKDNIQGASTITQQLAKNLFLSFDKTWERKLKEAWLTIELETQYSKDEILEVYLNTINYGGVYGIEKASNYYFNKKAKDLTLAEAAILAGIPKAPTKLSPILNYDEAKKRQATILAAMVKNDYITEQDMDIAYNTKLNFYGKLSKNDNTLMYYQDAVLNELKSIKSIPNSFLKTGGLKIYTYLDPNAQQILSNAIINNELDPEIEIAAIMMDPNNGHIIALTGGRDYNKSEFNRAINAKRQVGSTIKPFLYYAALENGFTASSTFTSEKTTFVFSEDKTYSPKNYADNYANKEISMATAISYSDNIYAVKTHLFLGEDTLVNMLKRVGIKSKVEPIPSLALGSEEISLLEMMQAYATFANLGNKVNGKLIKKVEDMNGNVLYENKDKTETVLNKSLAYIINELLTSTTNYNFIDYSYPTCYDITSKLTHKYAIKTGTTDTDHLIFGYNKDIVIGIWSGFDDNRKSNVVDGKNIKFIWADMAEAYMQDKTDEWYTLPNNVVGVLVDPITGTLATNETKNSTIFYYLKGTEPTIDLIKKDELINTIKIEE
ncbi:MAG: PBP1A family penicillin-binding protein [Bacilli bacterium]|nr:PBP1A family penicillin-binding protein [Bacilli bacterium]